MTCVLDYSIFVMRRGHDKKQLGSQGDSTDRVHSGSAAARRPTRTELLAAADKTVPDIIGPGLKILFCGINPGLYSAWAGHHFARPGNRFWPALFAGGVTERLLRPEEEQELLRCGYGITNLVERATVGSEELTREELLAGGRAFARKVRKYRPRAVAILGVSAYRLAFRSPQAVVGAQPERMAGASVWVLPNPSGLNAHFTPSTLARLFRKFRRDVLR
jgi:TDG/mug DNA glycosylase family protein